jgi:hypothetical protein
VAEAVRHGESRGGDGPGDEVVNWGKAVRSERRKCPKCGSSDVHRSPMRGIVERDVLRAIGIHVYRCERRDRRYYD